jgi:hypothetical protein
MDDFNWLDDYIEGVSSASSAPATTSPVATKKAKKTKKGSGNKPWFTKFPPIDRMMAMRIQFFDNGPNPGKGHTEHTLKFRVYLDDGQPLDQYKPHWHRVIELIEPKKVVAWADAEHVAGKLTDENLARYRAAADDLLSWKQEDPDAAWAKMGHISSPPGNHYFHNQFVTVRCTNAGEIDAFLYLEDGVIEIDQFYANKKSSKPNAPKRHALYDPRGVIVSKEADDDEL